MCKRFDYRLITRSRLGIGSYRAVGNFQEGIGYIPGSAVRGALAPFYLAACDNRATHDNHQACPQAIRENCQFFKIFVEDKVIFSDVLPVNTAVDKPVPPYHPDSPGLVLPATAVSCKRHAGFCTEDSFKQRATGKVVKEPYHGVFDTLIGRLIVHESKGKLFLHSQIRCPLCDEPIEAFSGFYRTFKSGEETIYFKCKVEPFIETRSANNRSRNTAEDEMLYSIQVIPEDISFRGTVLVLSDDVKQDELQQNLKQLKERRLGGDASRGFGEIDLQRVDEIAVSNDVATRIQSFNKVLQQEVKKAQCFCAGKNSLKQQYFTVSLQSDALLTGAFGEATTQLNAEMLRRELEDLVFANLPDFKLRLAFSQPDYCGGWSNVRRLPKTLEQAAIKGSVFVFSTDDIKPFYNPLQQLEYAGIGHRKGEGFGRILVSDAFHTEVIPK